MRLGTLGAALFLAGLPSLALGAPAPEKNMSGAAEPTANVPSETTPAAPPRGRPLVVLDRLDFPTGIPRATHYVQYLRRVLGKEAARADWGAGRGARVEYRFFVTELTLKPKAGVLVVECTAVGRLPRGKTAKSRIRFGGHPSTPSRVVEQVLEIVARGVVTRLAELERDRRERR